MRTQTLCYSIGWDVGGWLCSRNPRSRDALVILDASGRLLGTPWRGNLSQSIQRANCTHEWLAALFELCCLPLPTTPLAVTLAIDTPLGFSDALVRLLNRQGGASQADLQNGDAYLYRYTERYLNGRGLRPLSAVKDMIGSQASKGMHTVACFAPQLLDCGVWSDGVMLTAIEAYPAACRNSAIMDRLLSPFRNTAQEDSEECWLPELGHEDLQDALRCALVGHLFTNHPESLAAPPAEVSPNEGWIWAPEDGLL
ncbi:hypothetical protein [Crenobacter caeni]|uniref:DUF429 domain-containing protein n=1 Tax=Crenobacter caeni TaxID=2705474 RepID=A0A6B2KR58_9NEIS|nr:hypothetical protein [Crenobacter caeni]NDV12725.1 hypothetical protein [Crenobacter caeni]